MSGRTREVKIRAPRTLEQQPARGNNVLELPWILNVLLQAGWIPCPLWIPTSSDLNTCVCFSLRAIEEVISALSTLDDQAKQRCVTFTAHCGTVLYVLLPTGVKEIRTLTSPALSWENWGCTVQGYMARKQRGDLDLGLLMPNLCSHTFPPIKIKSEVLCNKQ